VFVTIFKLLIADPAQAGSEYWSLVKIGFVRLPKSSSFLLFGCSPDANVNIYPAKKWFDYMVAS